MYLFLYRRGPFCLWPRPSRPPRLCLWALFTMRVVTAPELLLRSFCSAWSPRQEMALWGTTGIHKYSSLEKFIEFVVKDLRHAAEVVMNLVSDPAWGGKKSCISASSEGRCYSVKETGPFIATQLMWLWFVLVANSTEIPFLMWLRWLKQFWTLEHHIWELYLKKVW